MKNSLNKLLIFFFVPMLFYSCINSDYDLENIDDSGGLSPALTLPIGYLNTSIIDFIEGAGIGEDILEIGADTIYVVYNGSMSLEPTQSIPFPSDIITTIPPIQFTFGGGEASMDIDVFEDLASSGSVLYPSNPKVYFTIRNYIGAAIDIDINSIKSHKDNEERSAVFINNPYSIHVGSAPAYYDYTPRNVIFDKTNGEMHKLFEISPDRISYNFSVDLTVPSDGNHFLWKNKFVDIDYEIRIPFTFSSGTKIANADTLDLDLSGDDFVSNLDEFALWIDYENRLRTTVDLEILFLDENKNLIPGIKKEFRMDAAPASGGTNQRDAQPAKGTLTLEFKDNEIDNAKKTQYIILNSILKTAGSGEVNIHPSDYINLKLSAYLKVNI